MATVGARVPICVLTPVTPSDWIALNVLRNVALSTNSVAASVEPVVQQQFFSLSPMPGQESFPNTTMAHTPTTTSMLAALQADSFAGTLDPAAMPVRRAGNIGPSAAVLPPAPALSPALPFFTLAPSSNTPRKCVGTPCSAVHRSSPSARTIAAGAKSGAGYTIDAPCAHAARLPRTRRAMGRTG